MRIVPQDRRRPFVVPVVDDAREDVRVAARHLLEEIARDEGEPLAEGRFVSVDLRQVEDDAAELRPQLEQRLEQRAVAAADVDDRLVVAPVELGEPRRVALPPAGHRGVEDRAFCRMLSSQA